MEHKTRIQAARIELEEFGHRPLGYPQSSSPLYKEHYTFDFAQQLIIPYHSRQEGPLYFSFPHKVQLFGVCIKGCREQYNYLVYEDQAIGKDGSSN